MFRLIDRLLILSYVKSYLICLVSLLGLYIVVDLFNNIDEFTNVKDGFGTTIKHIGVYYATQVTLIFDKLSETIVLLAAMFTVAWMQRNNEMLPLLSAGVSTRRIVRPVFFGACFFVAINIANQEFLIPRLGEIVVIRGDPNQESQRRVTASYDKNGVHVSGDYGVRKTLSVYKFKCVIPNSLHSSTEVRGIQAERAEWIPQSGAEYSGGWMLYDARPNSLNGWKRPNILEPIEKGQFFLYSDVDFDWITRDKTFFNKKSTWAILQEMNQADSHRLATIAVFFHMRLTRPLVGIILLFLGLGVILRDQNRHIFISIGSCLVLCALFFGTIVGARYLGDSEILSPAVSAWLPVFLFGPVAYVLFDAVHT